ncbi:MAG: potassium channel family protein [Planctomycetota bacterium]
MPVAAPARWISARYRHAYLLVALGGVIFVRPIFDNRSWSVGLIDLTLLITLVVGAASLVDNKRWFAPVAGLAALSALTQLVWVVWGGPPWLAYLGLSLSLTFCVTVACVFVFALLRYRGPIGVDTLCSALSAYLLLGLAWAIAYVILESASPGSFLFVNDPPTPDARLDRLMGFSFATLTTLGYGNIAPNSARADALATLQAVVGQVYLAVIIARLVSLQITQRYAPPPGG